MNVKDLDVKMKERPILFSTEMVRAIIDGRKTMTRRVVKPQPIDHISEVPRSIQNENDWGKFLWEDEEGKSNLKYSPYGQIGDVLWVRETWSPLVTGGDKNFYLVLYKADGSEPSSVGWKPSIHMPRFASRIFLRITNIRVERLNDITEEDAKREGVKPIDNGYKQYLRTRLDKVTEYATYSFMTLWESINGKGSWDQNPWVWVIEFEVFK